MEDEDITIEDNGNGEEAVENINKKPIRWKGEANCSESRLILSHVVDSRNNVANAKATIDGNKFVNESIIGMFEDVSEEREIDKDDGTNCERAINFVC